MPDSTQGVSISNDFTRRLYRRSPKKKREKEKKKEKETGEKRASLTSLTVVRFPLKRSHYSREDYRDERVDHSAVPFPEKQVVVSWTICVWLRFT